ncbi:hypothetical protein CY34DRAFT_805477, partial [Suillus luteus UH-Slu-Lm8-n1]
MEQQYSIAEYVVSPAQEKTVARIWYLNPDHVRFVNWTHVCRIRYQASVRDDIRSHQTNLAITENTSKNVKRRLQLHEA